MKVSREFLLTTVMQW